MTCTFSGPRPNGHYVRQLRQIAVKLVDLDPRSILLEVVDGFLLYLTWILDVTYTILYCHGRAHSRSIQQPCSPSGPGVSSMLRCAQKYALLCFRHMC
jgi:hypothetical protein